MAFYKSDSHIGLQEEVHNPFETHSKVDEGVCFDCY